MGAALGRADAAGPGTREGSGAGAAHSRLDAVVGRTRAVAGVLIEEVDSWFDYPMHDVLRLLEDDYATMSNRSHTSAT
jgi:hypothetical protein